MNSFKDGQVDLIIEEQAPLVLDASAQANSLRQALSGPLTLNVPEPSPATRLPDHRHDHPGIHVIRGTGPTQRSLAVSGLHGYPAVGTILERDRASVGPDPQERPLLLRRPHRVNWF